MAFGNETEKQAERRERARLRSERWRRAHGIMPRRPAQKPWLAEGCSRSTWYRRGNRVAKDLANQRPVGRPAKSEIVDNTKTDINNSGRPVGNSNAYALRAQSCARIFPTRRGLHAPVAARAGRGRQVPGGDGRDYWRAFALRFYGGQWAHGHPTCLRSSNRHRFSN
jgi:hypothetical protein